MIMVVNIASYYISYEPRLATTNIVPRPLFLFMMMGINKKKESDLRMRLGYYGVYNKHTTLILNHQKFGLGVYQWQTFSDLGLRCVIYVSTTVLYKYSSYKAIYMHVI